MLGRSHHGANGLYKSAITGAYFGILNILLIFIPLIYSLYGKGLLFGIYIFIGILFLALSVYIPVCLKGRGNYDFSSIRFLYFTGTYFLIFYLGIMANYIVDFGVSFSNMYIVILQAILVVMSSFDICLSAHQGMGRMKTLYLRTINIQYLRNALTIILGVLAGFLSLAPYFLME